MKLFVTGASGFVGSAVVAAAIARGHEVVRLVRRAEPEGGARVTDAVGDIRHPASWRDSLVGVDAVIHLAAAAGGDFHTQFSSTVLGTEALLGVMRDVGVHRLVHVSTFSVYDYRSIPVGSLLDESSPIEAHPLDRDEYAQTKLVQEQLVHDFALSGGEVTIVRPGAVYGAGKLWDAGLAVRLSRGVGLAYSPLARQKLTYLENCAEAIVLAAERPEAIGATVNIVDDDLPTQRGFARAQRRAGFVVPRSVPVPYRVAILTASTLALVNRRFAGGKAKLPAFVVPAKLDAQYRPLRYSNETAKRVLGWRPRYTLDEALLRVRDVAAQT